MASKPDSALINKRSLLNLNPVSISELQVIDEFFNFYQNADLASHPELESAGHPSVSVVLSDAWRHAQTSSADYYKHEADALHFTLSLLSIPNRSAPTARYKPIFGAGPVGYAHAPRSLGSIALHSSRSEEALRSPPAYAPLRPRPPLFFSIASALLRLLNMAVTAVSGVPALSALAPCNGRGGRNGAWPSQQYNSQR